MPSLIRHRNEMVGLWSYGFDASGPLPLEAALATANAVVAADLGYEPYSQPSPPLAHDSDDSDLEREAGAMEAGAVMSGRLALTGMRCDYDDDGYLDLALAAPNGTNGTVASQVVEGRVADTLGLCSNLPFLALLDLSGNAIGGALPNEFSTCLPALEHLFLVGIPASAAARDAVYAASANLKGWRY